MPWPPSTPITQVKGAGRLLEPHRVKNDFRDAADLADLLRMGRLPEAWIAPKQVRCQRELVRHRHKLRQLCSGLKAGAHAVLAKNGLLIPRLDMFGSMGEAGCRHWRCRRRFGCAWTPSYA